MTRSNAREIACHLVYEMNFNGITADEAMEEIGDRPIRLEMSRKATLETVRDMALSDFAITRRHPTFTFYYDVDGMTLEQARELRVWMIDQWTAQGLGR